jgi:hypothetical protein
MPQQYITHPPAGQAAHLDGPLSLAKTAAAGGQQSLRKSVQRAARCDFVYSKEKDIFPKRGTACARQGSCAFDQIWEV